MPSLYTPLSNEDAIPPVFKLSEMKQFLAMCNHLLFAVLALN